MISRFSILILVLFSCNLSDTSEQLFDGYQFVKEGPNFHYIIGGRNSIPEHIVDFSYDVNFLLIKQKPRLDNFIGDKARELYNQFKLGSNDKKDSVFLKFEELGGGKNDHKDYEICRELASKLVESDPLYIQARTNEFFYWILQRNTDKLFGPLSKSDFDFLRNSLQVSNKLQLK